MNSRDILLLVISILFGGFCALLARSAFHNPHAQPRSDMLKSSVPTVDHVNHVDHQVTHKATVSKPVNSICSICGMDVDADIPTAHYQGSVIGFACKKCPPLFAKDPEKYGPSYLKNEKLPK